MTAQLANTGLAGEMRSGGVFSILNVPGREIDVSNSLTNWTGADSAVMGTWESLPPIFSIYVCTVDLTGTTGGFGGNDLINVDIGKMPDGTFVAGYGEALGRLTSTRSSKRA